MRTLVVISPHVGGAKVALAVAAALGPEFEVTAVEDAGADPEALREAEVLVTALAPVTAEHLASAAKLRFVQCASHGYDHVDLVAAARGKVAVSNIGSTSAEAQDVAEHALCLILALAKQLIPGHNALREGDWALPRLQSGITELFGKTLGIVGFGAIGQQLARRAKAFDLRIVYTDPKVSPVEGEYDATRLPLDELLAQSDYVSLHVPLRPETRHLLDARRLALLRPTAILVNTARGALIDQDALAEALTEGRLAGAGLDVFDPEPPPADLPLLRAPNVVLSPHAAGVTRETVLRIAAAALDNVRRYAAGEQPTDRVTEG
ncbi:phosphoglycerate dehydrogenase [Solihabitans fulvus]|uniref:Phosphoglycerate dehydrogenase n=1 Tax=Solihabitans fulvus TaxID=1892852 RepID=A0A5B2XCH5_9PSEU|nr:2-hydroxyacid dehydrogenase [Solihabitans fulvus]KAA2261317.1 phosphoglycerate dehydrogenase [Solihabitans fulvus]